MSISRRSGGRTAHDDSGVQVQLLGPCHSLPGLRAAASLSRLQQFPLSTPGSECQLKAALSLCDTTQNVQYSSQIPRAAPVFGENPPRAALHPGIATCGFIAACAWVYYPRATPASVQAPAPIQRGRCGCRRKSRCGIPRTCDQAQARCLRRWWPRS